jgi:hypothetical protein
MARPKAKARNGARGAKRERAKKPKPTAEQLSDQQRQALTFAHRRKLKPLLAAEKAAKADVTKAYELAKKEGIPKKDLELAVRLETEEGIEAEKLEIERRHRMARWLGLGKQLELFDGKEIAAERNYEDGRRAGLDDFPARPPSHLNQKDAQHWLEGHATGRTALNAMRATGFKAPGEAVPVGEAAAHVVDSIAAH